MAPHSHSKRMPARKKYKIARKVKEHHRRLRREENRRKKKGGPSLRPKKDPGIPNSYPYKHELLEELQEKRERAEQQRVESAQQRRRENSLSKLHADAQTRTDEFESLAGGERAEQLQERNGGARATRAAYMREVQKVIDAADVMLEVLDARDPLGCRCYDVERRVLAATAPKRLVLVLNKVDLVPKANVQLWLQRLRSEYPTVAFHAALGDGGADRRRRLSHRTAPRGGGGGGGGGGGAEELSAGGGGALGADALQQLLKNYTRNATAGGGNGVRTALTVGVAGYPNVGKSSLINALKRTQAVAVGAAAGVTRGAQEVLLDRHVRLIDSPGVVFSASHADALVLRNAVNVESLEDVITPVETIVRRCGPEVLMSAFAIPAFSDVREGLALVAKKRGKLTRGGALDVRAAARTVLKEWNDGRIRFYSIPPAGPASARLSAKVVSRWAEEFDVDALVRRQTAGLDPLHAGGGGEDDDDGADYYAAAAAQPPAESSTAVGADSVDGDDRMSDDGDDSDEDDGRRPHADGSNGESVTFVAGVAKKKRGSVAAPPPPPREGDDDEWRRTNAKIARQARENIPQMNREAKLRAQRLKKQQRRGGLPSAASTDLHGAAADALTAPAVETADKMDDDRYDFSVLDS